VYIKYLLANLPKIAHDPSGDALATSGWKPLV